MSLPYETASAGDRALATAQKILESFGCKSFGTMIDQERCVVIVAFKWRDRSVQLEASWKGYAAAWIKEHPAPIYGGDAARRKHEQKALAIGRVAVCSVLRDWIKGQTTAVECGIMSFDAIFMPYMLLPTGERLIDRVEKMELLGPPPDSNVSRLERAG